MFSDPVKNIAQSGIIPGMEVADFGAGSGALVFAAAKAMLSTGRVYAVDVQQELLSKIKNNAVREGIYNVEVILGDIEKPKGSKLRDNFIDFVLLSNILFQVENKNNVIEEARRILKPGGAVLVVDWSDSFGNLGPKPESVVTKAVVQDLFEKLGFHLEREIDAGAHHYGLIFKKL